MRNSFLYKKKIFKVLILGSIISLSYAGTWNADCVLNTTTEDGKTVVDYSTSTSGIVVNGETSSSIQFTCPSNDNQGGTWTIDGSSHDQGIAVYCVAPNGESFQPQSFDVNCSNGDIAVSNLSQDKTNVYFDVNNQESTTGSVYIDNIYCNSETTGVSSINTPGCAADYLSY